MLDWTPVELAEHADVRPTVLFRGLATRDRCLLSKEDEYRVREAIGRAGVIILEMIPRSLGVHKLPSPSDDEADREMPAPDSHSALLEALREQVGHDVAELRVTPSYAEVPGGASEDTKSRVRSDPTWRPSTRLSRKLRGRRNQMPA